MGDWFSDSSAVLVADNDCVVAIGRGKQTEGVVGIEGRVAFCICDVGPMSLSISSPISAQRYQMLGHRRALFSGRPTYIITAPECPCAVSPTCHHARSLCISGPLLATSKRGT
ncbi:hypothetical protein EVAR_98418_1 [Eumeta japonica]|uniref:Uncharacterized protein n=1 Tax=Eumeta variegata TaxID=151549 RepID=A0A4C2AIF7_EUMVA|nr:hypothetical protein EVAR_98418_1 [Eumeta japonica]